MPFGCLLFGDAFTFVFHQQGIGRDIARREDAATMNRGIPDNERRLGGRCSGSGFGFARWAHVEYQWQKRVGIFQACLIRR
jgi:hypothetical protein